MPMPRKLNGNISAMISHRQGPIHDCMNQRKTIVIESTIYGKAGEPSKFIAASAIISKLLIVPSMPALNIVTRPIFPKSQIPKKVAITEVKPFATFAMIAICRPKPASVKICVP